MQFCGQELGGIEREKVLLPRRSMWGFIGAEAGDFGAALGYREAAAPQPIYFLGLSPSSGHLRGVGTQFGSGEDQTDGR